jgi:phosphatidylglycerol:prolipoprotein diacylglycerol transferase
MDLTAVSAGVGYTFGRIGNFLNQELVGRPTDSPLGIWVGATLRHPSQLYEAFFEGVVIFAILYSIRLKKTFDGQLAMIYGILYGLLRAFCEFFREPDPQIGYLLGSWLTMGMLLSFMTAVVSAVGYVYIRSKNE